jgi:hypothetical protein
VYDDPTSGFLGRSASALSSESDREPDRFLMPSTGDLGYQWIDAWMDALDYQDMCELITAAWRMCLPKRLRRQCSDQAQEGDKSGSAEDSANPAL